MLLLFLLLEWRLLPLRWWGRGHFDPRCFELADQGGLHLFELLDHGSEFAPFILNFLEFRLEGIDPHFCILVRILLGFPQLIALGVPLALHPEEARPCELKPASQNFGWLEKPYRKIAFA